MFNVLSNIHFTKYRLSKYQPTDVTIYFSTVFPIELSSVKLSRVSICDINKEYY